MIHALHGCCSSYDCSESSTLRWHDALITPCTTNGPLFLLWTLVPTYQYRADLAQLRAQLVVKLADAAINVVAMPLDVILGGSLVHELAQHLWVLKTPQQTSPPGPTRSVSA